MKTYIDTLYNCDDNLGLQLMGPVAWNGIKGRVCGVTSSMLEHPEKSAARPISTDRRADDLFLKLFRPNLQQGAELLGGGWCERVTDATLGDSISEMSDNVLSFVNSEKFGVASDIFHNAANIFQHVPGYGAVVPAARKVTNTAADVLTSLGFGTKAEDVKTAAKWGGAAVLIGGGVAIWYFGFYKKKRRGRR